MQFGQVVIGPPGCGKTTYCNAMSEFLTSLGRQVITVNLDPANDCLPFTPTIDISSLITLEDVMEHHKLGPNGGLVFCMEYLEANVDWLLREIAKHPTSYLLFDCPGQVELYTHHDSVKNVVSCLQKQDFRLTAIHLVDSHYCGDPSKFIAGTLTSLTTMLQMELPHVNVLSKADIIEKYGKPQFNLDFYTEVLDLSYLLEQMEDDPFLAKHKKLHERLVGVIEDYGLVSFLPLSVKEKTSVCQVARAVDQANGYVFGTNENTTIQKMLSYAADFEYAKIGPIKEKYMDTDEYRDDDDV